MQVKDYLQVLSDDSKIRVEKIGSGNWYWSFASEEKHSKMAMLEKVREERDKAVQVMEEVKEKVEEAGKARKEDDDEDDEADGDEEMLAGVQKIAGNRAELTTRHAVLAEEVQSLREELASYSENDPAEADRKRNEATQAKALAEKWTEQAYALESWLINTIGGDREQMIAMKMEWYRDEYDEEGEGLKEL